LRPTTRCSAKRLTATSTARDTSEGRIWCDVNQLKTPDPADELADQIKKLPAAERKKNASVLILGLLGRDFPCRAKRSKP